MGCRISRPSELENDRSECADLACAMAHAAWLAQLKLVPQGGHETYAKFAPPSLGMTIKAFDLFPHVFKYTLTDAARKPRRSQNPTNGAGFQTGTLMIGPKDAPSCTPRQSERRNLLVKCHKSSFNKSFPDFRNLRALLRLQV